MYYTVHKVILRCVGFFFYIFHFICKADEIIIDPTYTSRIIVPIACLNILLALKGGKRRQSAAAEGGGLGEMKNGTHSRPRTLLAAPVSRRGLGTNEGPFVLMPKPCWLREDKARIEGESEQAS